MIIIWLLTKEAREQIEMINKQFCEWVTNAAARRGGSAPWRLQTGTPRTSNASERGGTGLNDTPTATNAARTHKGSDQGGKDTASEETRNYWHINKWTTALSGGSGQRRDKRAVSMGKAALKCTYIYIQTLYLFICLLDLYGTMSEQWRDESRRGNFPMCQYVHFCVCLWVCPNVKWLHVRKKKVRNALTAGDICFWSIISHMINAKHTRHFQKTNSYWKIKPRTKRMASR